MKPLSYLPYILILALGVWIFLLLTEKNVEDKSKQVEIDFLRAKNIKDKDLFEKILKLQADSLRIAKHTIILQADTIKNQELDKQNYKRNRHDKIVFVVHSDSSRTKELVNLYPSFKPN